MGEHFQFGGGANQTTMTPVVLFATLVAAVLVLLLPRKYALAPILAVTFLTPFGQQIYVGGFHFFVTRIIILAGTLRLIWAGVSKETRLFEPGLGALDKAFCLLTFFHVFTFVLLYREGAAIVNQAAACLDSYGGYFLFRHLVRNEEDVRRAGKALAAVVTVLAFCMGYEYLTGVNAFNTLRGYTLVPWIREGKVRAQAVFGNSITAGSFGGTLLPLFFWLWKSGKSRMWGGVGLLAASVVALTAVAGTAMTTFVSGIGALCVWPIRKRMRVLRWGISLTILGLALAMKAPVWFVITRFDIIGGAHAWDRAALIDQFVRHFSDWWLLGTKDNASWGADTWDACNQFVAEGTGGGLVCFVLFIVLLCLGFSMIGGARRAVQGDHRREWFFWCLGVALFCHLMTFWGIDYFDQIRMWWLLFVAMLPAATASALAKGQLRHAVASPTPWSSAAVSPELAVLTRESCPSR